MKVEQEWMLQLYQKHRQKKNTNKDTAISMLFGTTQIVLLQQNLVYKNICLQKRWQTM